MQSGDWKGVLGEHLDQVLKEVFRVHVTVVVEVQLGDEPGYFVEAHNRLQDQFLVSQASNIRHNNTSEVILKFQPFMKECIILVGLGYQNQPI